MGVHSEGIDLADLLNGTVNYVFVAMDFQPEFDAVFSEAIAPAVREGGLLPVRSDQIVSAGGVVAHEILQLVRHSTLVVADITGSNPNVILEVGLALANGKDIVFLTQDDQISFDIQHHRRIKYSTTTDGLAEARAKISGTLKTATNEDIALLQAMLWKGAVDLPLTIVHGSPSPAHLSTLSPAADSAYMSRLGRSSAQTTGIIRLADAHQKLARGQGLLAPAFRVANANGVVGPNYVDLASGNVFVLGGPAGNKVFADVMDHLDRSASGSAVISKSADGRYLVSRSGVEHPANQAEMFAVHNVDVGVVVRLESPWRKGAIVWCAAGTRSFGTEAAIDLMVSPKALRELNQFVELDQPNIWAIVAATFDPRDARMTSFEVREAAEFNLTVQA